MKQLFSLTLLLGVFTSSFGQAKITEDASGTTTDHDICAISNAIVYGFNGTTDSIAEYWWRIYDSTKTNWIYYATVSGSNVASPVSRTFDGTKIMPNSNTTTFSNTNSPNLASNTPSGKTKLIFSFNWRNKGSGTWNQLEDTITIWNYPAATPNLGNDTGYCVGSGMQLDGGIYDTYSWSNGANTRYVFVFMPGTYNVTVSTPNGCSTASDTIVVSEWQLPNVNLGPDTSFCDGDTIMIDGGNYASYSWSTTDTSRFLSVSSPNIFILTATDTNGCINSDTISVTQLSLPSVSLGPDTNICDGDVISISPGPNYSSYSWSTGSITSSIVIGSAANYMVTVSDANGCFNSDDLTLGIYALPTPQISNDTIVCPGESVTVSCGSFTSYSWSTTATSSTINVMNPGDYRVTVTDVNGCSAASDTMTLSNFAPPLPGVSNDTSFCDGDSVVISVGTHSIYAWSTGATSQSITVSTAGTYTVTVTDMNGCFESDSATIGVFALPVVDLGNDTTICVGDTISISGGSFATYTWSTAETTENISVSDSNIYWVSVIDLNGCAGSDTMQVMLDGCGIGLGEQVQRSLRVYPNPFRSNLTITSDKDIEQISFFDASGRLVYRRTTSGKVANVESDLPTGLYFLEVKMNGESHRMPLVRE